MTTNGLSPEFHHENRNAELAARALRYIRCDSPHQVSGPAHTTLLGQVIVRECLVQPMGQDQTPAGQPIEAIVLEVTEQTVLCLLADPLPTDHAELKLTTPGGQSVSVKLTDVSCRSDDAHDALLLSAHYQSLPPDHQDDTAAQLKKRRDELLTRWLLLQIKRVLGMN